MEVEATKATNNNDPYMTVAAAVEAATPAVSTITTTTPAVAATTGHHPVGGGDHPGTTEKVLAWLGCLIVNAAFISFIIFWIATDKWWIGFVVSMLYTTLLFVLAHAWSEDEDPKNKWRRCFWFCSSPSSTLTAVVEGDSMAGPFPRRRPRMLVTLLYGLAVLSLGGTGLLLSLNAIRCHGMTNNNNNNDGWAPNPPPSPSAWTTDVTSLPASVRSWAEQPATTDFPPRGATFLHLPDSGITLFDEESTDGDRFYRDNPIWSVSANVNNGQPVVLHNYPGHEFVLISNNNNNNNNSATTGCFATTTAGSTDPDSLFAWVPVPTVACSDGRTIRFVDVEMDSDGAPMVWHVDPRDLMVDNNTGLVWYKDNPPRTESLTYNEQYETLIYSLDPIQMVETLHSQRNSNKTTIEVVIVDNNDVDDENKDDDDDDTSCRRQVATASLFLAALPITFLSIYLWYRRYIPSMGMTVFAGMIGTAWCILLVTVPSNDWLEDHADDFSNWLLLSLGAIWMIFTTNGILSLSSSRASSLSSSSAQQYKVAPMRWGLNIGALIFFVGSFRVLTLISGFFSGLFDHDHAVPESLRWILFNVAVLAPTCLLGLATQSSLLLVLTAAGLVFDALRLSHAITRPMDDDSLVALVYFVVLGGTGLAIAVLGWWTSRRQGQLADRFSSYLAPYTWWPSPRPTTTTVSDRQQPDDGMKSTTTTKVAILSTADYNATPTPSRDVPFPPEAAPPTTNTAAAVADEETTV
jgi:hypothetical protein